MSEYLEGLHLIPKHMRPAVVDWVENGLPHPDNMGGFFRAILSNDLMGAASRADDINGRSLREWCLFFYNYAPSTCFGSKAAIVAWHEAHHPNPANTGTRSL